MKHCYAHTSKERYGAAHPPAVAAAARVPLHSGGLQGLRTGKTGLQRPQLQPGAPECPASAAAVLQP